MAGQPSTQRHAHPSDDERTDFFAIVGNELWALAGYHGATIDQGTHLAACPWPGCGLVTIQDISGDGITDLIYCSDYTGRLLVCKGIAASGGANLDSLESDAASSRGADAEYGAAGWSTRIPSS